MVLSCRPLQAQKWWSTLCSNFGACFGRTKPIHTYDPTNETLVMMNRQMAVHLSTYLHRGLRCRKTRRYQYLMGKEHLNRIVVTRL